MTLSKNVNGVLEQWLENTIPWMRARHGLKMFKFKTKNNKFNDKVCRELISVSEKVLITDCLHIPKMLSIIERSRSTIGEMTESFLKKAIMSDVDKYNHVPSSEAVPF